MAMKRVFLFAIGIAFASCHAPDGDRRSAVAQDVCTECVDPESTADQSYVSIGVMPARYPIDWGTPNKMYITTLAASLGFAPGESLNNPHGIGHVLLKVRCSGKQPFYISQTGAQGNEAKQFLELDRTRVNLMFKTYDDGKLYTDPEAEKDWNDSVDRQKALENPPGTYDSDPKDVKDGELKKAKLLSTVDIDALIGKIKALPKLPRHHFVRATIRISDAQCDAIRSWRDDYTKTGGQKRYALHRAPWVMDASNNYDGGACGSVSFAGAFYASGLDYKKAAARVIEVPQIGNGRLTASIARDGRKLDGWYLLQNKAYNVPGAVPCAKTGAACTASTKPWLDPLYDRWNGPEDAAGLFGINWLPLGVIGGGPAMLVNTTKIPLAAFEPEKFYQEILTRWNQANGNYDAFAHGDWCKIDGKVPTIVLDGRNDGAGKPRTGRPAGLRPGFDNPEVNLF